MAKKTTNLTSAEKRKLDNQVNKINKRLIRMAKTGMEFSATYKDTTSAISNMAGKIINQKLKSMGYTQAPASGTGKLFSAPIKYVKVQAADGTTVSVPQISRAAWILEAAQNDLSEIESFGSGLEERINTEEMLKATGNGTSDVDVQKSYIMSEIDADSLSYIWRYLYGLKHIQEVKDFFDIFKPEKKGTWTQTDLDIFNEQARYYYGKYASQVDVSQIKKRELTGGNRYYVFGNPKTGLEGVSERKLWEGVESIQNGDMVGAVKAAEDYLRYTLATESDIEQPDGSRTLYKHDPTKEELDEVYSMMNYLATHGYGGKK